MPRRGCDAGPRWGPQRHGSCARLDRSEIRVGHDGKRTRNLGENELSLATSAWPLDDCGTTHHFGGWFGKSGIETITKTRHEFPGIGRSASDLTTPLGTAQASWMTHVWERLQELQRLPENWNGYGELPIALEAVAQSVAFLSAIGPTVPIPDVMPMPDGGLQIEFSGSGCELEVEVRPHGGVAAFFVDADGHEQEFEVAAGDVSEVRTLVAAMG